MYRECLNCRAAIVLLLAAPRLASAVNFNSPALYVPGAQVTSMAVADFNGDGKPDLAVPAAGDAFNYVSILLNNGDGAFRAGATYSTTTPPLSSQAISMATGSRTWQSPAPRTYYSCWAMAMARFGKRS
jgi:hypothetical protein